MSVIYGKWKPQYSNEMFDWIIDRKLAIWNYMLTPKHLHVVSSNIEGMLKKGRERRVEERFYPTTNIRPIIMAIFEAQTIEIHE